MRWSPNCAIRQDFAARWETGVIEKLLIVEQELRAADAEALSGNFGVDVRSAMGLDCAVKITREYGLGIVVGIGFGFLIAKLVYKYVPFTPSTDAFTLIAVALFIAGSWAARRSQAQKG